MSVTHISKICHLLFEAEVHNNAKIKGSIINVSLVPLFICAYWSDTVHIHTHFEYHYQKLYIK